MENYQEISVYVVLLLGLGGSFLLGERIRSTILRWGVYIGLVFFVSFGLSSYLLLGSFFVEYNPGLIDFVLLFLMFTILCGESLGVHLLLTRASSNRPGLLFYGIFFSIISLISHVLSMIILIGLYPGS